MFKTEKHAFVAALASIIGVVNRNAKIPIQQNALFERDSEAVTVRGTSMDIEMAARFTATVAADFEDFTVPAHLVADAVKSMPDGQEIRVERIDQAGKMIGIYVKSGRSRIKLPVLPASDFPKLDAATLPNQLSLASSVLARALKATVHAVSTDQTRYYLAGVYLRPKKEGLHLVATDGLRLSVRLIKAIDIDQEDAIAKLPPIIIPTKAVEAILKIIADGEDVTVDYSDMKLRISCASRVMTAKLVEATFPDYERIQPEASAIRTSFSASTLSGAIARVLVATPDAGLGVAFRFAAGALAINARDYAVGEGDDEIDCEADGEIETGYNGKHMREALEHTEGDAVELLTSTGASPSLLRAAGDDLNYTILMPMKPKGARSS
ncbi:DNA polymerase-3 subunit beta [Mycoplana sp. BE70]|uniref:DNA polymerase III subunit beta n=1 Tax=Mycoplana sp. BE70 TaxID=2817775 RepID=UPI0028575A07|nr:DNA polymerase III subunit beta [Mycoplana sp. BE70]MDR6757806.1 DNA polymerase-3 subunit beta [Mycoplana sp. BE70]